MTAHLQPVQHGVLLWIGNEVPLYREQNCSLYTGLEASAPRSGVSKPKITLFGLRSFTLKCLNFSVNIYKVENFTPRKKARSHTKRYRMAQIIFYDKVFELYYMTLDFTPVLAEFSCASVCHDILYLLISDCNRFKSCALRTGNRVAMLHVGKRVSNLPKNDCYSLEQGCMRH